ncbi:glycosyltransferase family 4 protein [Mucilaginibacter sp. 14171R-50]|uniref:glycosyltransferase family 4 protein n=1 Tax=Mucilaginibacter sp. 14171R-50 TaxID=2703789 RepID=UPI00138BB801|nr:glycosyltransferase family 4 protein [Mucilaginibacter sp. 14171R-50]QHS54752.1 glycosyltransferase family 4 protein [Mucilaginibacter sp. 14171R-50]
MIKLNGINTFGITNYLPGLRILILTHRTPFPQNGGYPIVVGNTIKGLVALGHQVSLISLNVNKYPSATPESDELLEKINYIAYNIDTRITMIEAVSNLFTHNSYNIDKYYNAGFEKLLLKNLQENEYDVIQLEGIFVGPYLGTIRKASKAKVIFRAHNIEHQVWQKLAQQKSDPLKKWYLQLLARRIKNYELELLNKFDGIVVFTEQDKGSVISFGNKVPLKVLPIGIDLSLYKPDHSKTDFPSLFFLGSLDWLPNREGIEWFMDNFHKDLTDGPLKAKFYVAGHNIPEQFDDYEVLGKVFIHGEVDDALEFVNSKSIMIVPLLSGGGMRVKIVEGMAMEKCIISTSLGAEGINVENGKNIIIANNVDEFYKAVKKCITDEHYCLEIGRNARKLVEQQHNINTIIPQLTDFYQSIV